MLKYGKMNCFLAVGLSCFFTNCKTRYYSQEPDKSSSNSIFNSVLASKRAQQGKMFFGVSKTGVAYSGMFFDIKGEKIRVVPGFSFGKQMLGKSDVVNRLESEFAFVGGPKKQGLFRREQDGFIETLNRNCLRETFPKKPLVQDRMILLGVPFPAEKNLESQKWQIPESMDLALDSVMSRVFAESFSKSGQGFVLEFSEFESETTLFAGEIVSFRNKANEIITGKFLAAQPNCFVVEQTNSEETTDISKIQAYRFEDIQIDSLRTQTPDSAINTKTNANPVDAWPMGGIEAFVRKNSYRQQGNNYTFAGVGQMVEQGFKLYVAANDESLQVVASFVLPFLVSKGVAHHVRSDLENFAVERGGEKNGKLISIYAKNDSEARMVADFVESHFLKNPVRFWPVPEYTLGRSGMLSARFQAFLSTHGGGLVKPDKTIVEPVKKGTLKPIWVNNPFEGL